MTVSINQELCRACGVCGHVCPRHIPEVVETGGMKATVISSQRSSLCMECGHCAAVCPSCAIEVKCFSGREFDPVQELEMDGDRLLPFMRQRRSVRRYRENPVPREIINRIINAAHCSPTGTGRMTTGVIVIDDRKSLATLSELAYRMYEGLGKSLNNPVARLFIKRRAGEKRLRALQDFVMPGMHWYIRWYKEGKSNEILRDCPALVLFHSPVYEPVGEQNCLLAAFHAIMMAQTMDIGTCFNDLIPPACNRVPEIRKLLGLDDDREVYASITMGYPKYHFRRIVPRDLAEVRYLT
ncbi:nitroreductase family protein [bacterium]|nr:nitroreductase family protein [bacterium]